MRSRAAMFLIAVLVSALALISVQAQEDGDVRVVQNDGTIFTPENIGTRNSVRGRLEVYYNSQWGSVCYYGFDTDLAQGACEEFDLYFLHSWGRVSSSSNYQEASPSTPIWQLFNCSLPTGNYSTTYSCQFRGIGQHNCTHTDDIGVTCAENSQIIFFSPDAVNTIVRLVVGIVVGVIALIVIAVLIIVCVVVCICAGGIAGIAAYYSNRKSRRTPVDDHDDKPDTVIPMETKDTTQDEDKPAPKDYLLPKEQ